MSFNPNDKQLAQDRERLRYFGRGFDLPAGIGSWTQPEQPPPQCLLRLRQLVQGTEEIH